MGLEKYQKKKKKNLPQLLLKFYLSGETLHKYFIYVVFFLNKLLSSLMKSTQII